MRLEPLLDCVIIEPVKTVNGLHLPDRRASGLLSDGADDRFGSYGAGLQRGTISAVGDGVRRLKVGDEVFYGVRARASFAELVHFEGKDFIICPAETVVARVVEEPR